MIIAFHVELHGDRQEKIPVSCKEKDLMSAAIASLRRKLSLGHDVPMDIRLPNGAPIKDLSQTVQSLGLANMASVHVFVDKKDAVKEVELLQVPEKLYFPEAVRAQEEAEKSKNSNIQFKGKVEKLGPQPTEDSLMFNDEVDVEEEDEEEETVNAGIHSIKVNGVYLKSYARGNVPNGGIVWLENAVVSVPYPKQLVEVVKSHERLHNRTYDPNFQQESSIEGMDPSVFSRYLSIAVTHGLIVNTQDEHGKGMAFYPEMSSIRHSCAPNCYVMKNKKHFPFRAALRCASAKGINSGEEVTMLYAGADLLSFMLLPKDRRQILLQHLFHFTCNCTRCERYEDDETERTITGAFWSEQEQVTTAQQKEHTGAMRKAFNDFNLINANGIPTPVAKVTGTIPDLMAFVEKYTSPTSTLRLHKNHWRVSLARIALIAKVAHEAKPDKFLSKSFFGILFDQLETESHFVPNGHPFSLIHFRKFLALQKRLPDQLAAAVQKKAVSHQEVPWKVLQATNKVWK